MALVLKYLISSDHAPLPQMGMAAIAEAVGGRMMGVELSVMVNGGGQVEEGGDAVCLTMKVEAMHAGSVWVYNDGAWWCVMVVYVVWGLSGCVVLCNGAVACWCVVCSV